VTTDAKKPTRENGSLNQTYQMCSKFKPVLTRSQIATTMAKSTNVSESMPDMTNQINLAKESNHKYVYYKSIFCNSSVKPRKFKRDREPSRISLKFYSKTLLKKKRGDKCVRRIIQNCPKTSFLNSIVKNKNLLRQKLAKQERAFPENKYSFSTRSHLKLHAKCKQHTCCFIQRKLYLSGDVELNPGPLTENNQNKQLVLSSMQLLTNRLNQYNLQPLDVGGQGDCFFRSVSHQLHSNPNCHLHIRALAIQYLQEHPERFIESNIERSWQQYLNNMSQQGTWADHIIIQAVADALHLRINIIETSHGFTETTVVEGTHFDNHPLRNIYIGHLGELHYVSTVIVINNGSSSENVTSSKNISSFPVCANNNATQNEAASCQSTEITHERKEKRNIYMKEYMRKRRLLNKKVKTPAERNAQKRYCEKNKDKIRDINKKASLKRTLNQPEHFQQIKKRYVEKKTRKRYKKTIKKLL